MRQTFQKSNLIMLDGTVAAVIGNGSAFVNTENGDQIYVPGRQVDIMRVDAGDTVRCWCLHNDPEHANTAKYRSVRAMALSRLADTMGAPTNAMAEALGALYSAPPGIEVGVVAETPTASPATYFPAPRKVEPLDDDALFDAVSAVMDRSAIFTTKDVHAVICEAMPQHWGDTKLISRITNMLNSMNLRGDVTLIRVYREGDQSHATAVLYARSVELALQIMKGRA